MLKPAEKQVDIARLRTELCSAADIRLRFTNASCCNLNCIPNLIRDSSSGYNHSSSQFCQLIGVPDNHLSVIAFDNFVEEVRKPFYDLTMGSKNEGEASKQLRHYLVQKFSENRTAKTEHYFKFVYTLHSLVRGSVTVCKCAYVILTGVKVEVINYAQRLVRDGVSAESVFMGNNNLEDANSDGNVNSLRAAFDHFALDFNLYEQNINNFVEVVNIPDTPTGYICATFLAEWFQLAGEQEPNADEIHIDVISQTEVFEEYKTDPYVLSHEKVYSYNSFIKIWRDVFPKIKIREYKNVTGKCAVCDACKNMSSKNRSKSMRLIIRQYKLMHRAYYMGEKLLYYQRRAEAAGSNGEIGSIIIDKMGTHSTQLPILSNLNSLKPPFPVAVTGAISHGSNETTFYVSTPNVSTGASYTIHCILSELRKLYQANKYNRLKKVYIEIDGASDNVAKAVLAACEHVVYKKFCDQLVLARLPVGHTHEDIDSRFGKIWTYIRTKHIYTFDAFIGAIHKAFGCSSLISVQPVFAIYDYKNYYDRFIDPQLVDKYSRQEFTQLYFKVQPLRDEDYACNPSNLLVRTNYRKFGQDYSVHLRPNPVEERSDSVADVLPFQPVLLHAVWMPENATDIICPYPQPCRYECPCKEKAIGISFLKAVPVGMPNPLKFEAGWLASFSKFLDLSDSWFRLRKEYSVADYWAAFARLRMPRSENVDDFLVSYDIDIPLGEYLYGSASFIPSITATTDDESTIGRRGRNNTTGFSDSSHRLRASIFDLELMDHIRQSIQSIPWRGHRFNYHNWEFDKPCILTRVLCTRGSGSNKTMKKGTCVAWCSSDCNEGIFEKIIVLSLYLLLNKYINLL